MHNIIHDGTSNPEHPEFELHYRAELDMADFDDGTSSYDFKLSNNFYMVIICPIVETGHPEHFLEPMRMSIYFDGGDIHKRCSIDTFIIPDKPIPHEPELGWISSGFGTDEYCAYHWSDNTPVPAKFYHAAMTLIEADKLVRKMYPGYCIIRNRPELEIPDELPEPFQYRVLPYILEQEKARKAAMDNPSK